MVEAFEKQFAGSGLQFSIGEFRNSNLIWSYAIMVQEGRNDLIKWLLTLQSSAACDDVLQ